MGLTIIDSLDTIILMDLPEPYFAAREWIKHELRCGSCTVVLHHSYYVGALTVCAIIYCRFDANKDINVFETNIRVVGGLLGAYELSGDDLFLHKAAELAERLLIAFNTCVWCYLPLQLMHGS